MIRSRRTWARSYCACWMSQPCSVPPKTFASLTAISGDMPRFALTSSESVLRVTPRAAAALVMVRPEGSMHSCRTTTPGCGGFFMVMGWFLSVVIDIIDLVRAAIEAEDHPPVGPDSHGPKAFPLAFERMQPESRHVHMSNGGSGMKRCQNIPQLGNMFGADAARVFLLKEPFQSLVADRPYHSAP